MKSHDLTAVTSILDIAFEPGYQVEHSDAVSAKSGKFIWKYGKEQTIMHKCSYFFYIRQFSIVVSICADNTKIKPISSSWKVWTIS